MKIRSLQIHQLDGSNQTVRITEAVTTLGRADDNDVVLDDLNVSRHHARIECASGGTSILTDLNSANGVVVNGHRVTGPVTLQSEDYILMGPFRLVFREETGDKFTIQTADLDLDELQQDPQLLARSAGTEPCTPGQLRSLELLYEVGMTLAKGHSVEEVMALAVEVLFKIENVTRAAVLLWNEEKAFFENAEISLRGGNSGSVPGAAYDPHALVMSRTILNRVRQENRPLLIRDARADARLVSSASIVRAGIQAAFCSPLFCQGRLVGVLYADNLVEPDAFSDTDFRTFTAIAAQTGLALGNAIASKELVRREVQRQALKAYLPPQVADLVLASDGAVSISGALRQITVLFADIRDFTRMSEQMDARAVVDMLNKFFTRMSAVVFRFGGTVDKFIGDCIMALFGAPLPCECSADQALAAAIEMQKAATLLRSSGAGAGLEKLHIGIGLHSGPAVVGNVGSADRVQYTAVGDTVNVASRLVSLAEPGQIIVSEDCRKALSKAGRFSFIDEAELKGRQTKLNIYAAQWLECE